jgi:CBS domain containing-hemolysin-like protein
MSFVIDLVVAAFAGVLLLLLSTLKTAYGQISDVSLHILRAARSDGRAAFLGDVMNAPGRFRTSLLLGIHGSVVAISAISVHVMQKVGVRHSILAGFLAATIVVVLARVVLPILIAQNAPDRVLLALVPLFRPYYVVMSIVGAPIAALVASFRRQDPVQEDNAEEDSDDTMSDIQAFIGVAEEEGIIEESEGALIQSIVELGDTQVREVMTPRTQIVALPNTSTVLDARDLMVAAKHSRLPVFSEQIDNVDGVLYVRDVLGAWCEGREGEPATSIMRPAYFVPEVKAVADLLEEMRKSQMQIALVIDEYGALAGLVTIEDLLEEIVGEIEDEDVEPGADDDIVEEPDGAIVVKGSTEIRKVELRFDLELEADDFTTVAGLVISELGHLPSRGERLEIKGLEVEVLEADSRRVNLLRVRPRSEARAEDAPEAARQGSKRDD